MTERHLAHRFQMVDFFTKAVVLIKLAGRLVSTLVETIRQMQRLAEVS